MEPRSSQNTRHLRASLIIGGHTYESIAKKIGVSAHTVKAAIHGRRGGPKSKRVIETIQKLSHAA